MTLGTGLTQISSGAFTQCISLKKIVIPANVKTISDKSSNYYSAYGYAGVFEGCTALTKVTIGDTSTDINLTTIGSEAFYGCTSLKMLYIGNGVSKIASSAFNKCSALESVTLGNHITVIDSWAFEGCSELKSITIPDSVTGIGSFAFAGCSRLESVMLGTGLTQISSGAFTKCISLNEIVIPANVKTISDKSSNYYSAYGYAGVFEGCTALTKVTIGDTSTDINLTTIGSEAFYDCSALSDVYIGSTVGKLNGAVFYNCSALMSINYAGTEDDWTAIIKGNNWDYNTGPYTIKYNCNIEIVETYTVTFKDYDGTILKVENVEREKSATAPAVPVREGYNFTGWDKFFDRVTSDLVVTATYSIISPEECTHVNKKFVDYLYEDITYIDKISHSVKVISQYRCLDCKEAITDYANAIVKTEDHIHDFVVNGGWVCRCGHIQDVAFDAYKAHLQSDVNRTTYYDPQLTIRYGTVYVSDEITVIGSTDNAYLIKYPLDAGGYKFAFIEKQYIDRRVYEKNSKINVYVKGITVSAVNNNEKVYANLNELINAIDDWAYIFEQDGYNLTIRAKNTNNKEIYRLNIDLADYLNKNWANVYATKEGETQYVPGFCIGAYVYTDEIFIELQEFMELLEFRREENCYVPSDSTLDLKLYANALHILNGGANFDALHESFADETVGWVSSLLYHLFTLDWGDMFSSNVYYTDDEIVAAIKQMLYDRCYPVNITQIGYDNEIMKSIGGLLSLLEDGTDTIGMEMGELEYCFAALLREDGFGDLFGSLKTVCNKFSNLMKTGGNIVSSVEFYDLMMEEVVVMATIQFKYEENMAVLDLLIKNETDTKVIAIYEKVRKELQSYYAEKADAVFQTLINNSETRNKFVENIIEFGVEKSKEGFLKKTALANPYYLAYEITCFVANETLHGEALYEAKDGIYRMHNTLEFYLPSMRNAVVDYYSSPTKDNAERLIAISVIAANLRIQASDYCIDYISSKVFDHSEEVYKNEKKVFEDTLQNIKKIFAEISK